jgi:hypothetical protein
LSQTSPHAAVREGSVPLLDGGPTQRILARVGLAKRSLPTLVQGSVMLALVAWLPLLAFSAFQGLALGGVEVPFLLDFGAHARLFCGIPLLIIAEAVVGPRLGRAAAHLVERGIIKDDDLGRFDETVTEAYRLRDSASLEVAVLVLAYIGSFLALGLQFFSGDVSRWDLRASSLGARPTLAGIWSMFVAIPLFQFLLFRTFVRLLIWWRFLWGVSRLDLQLVPTHPDRAGGIAFLGGAHRPLGLIGVAVGSVLSGRYCTDILFQGGSLVTLKAPVATAVVLVVILCLGPLLMFMPQLMAARRKGLVEYGALAYRYTKDFDRKWVRAGGKGAGEELLGTGDIQSLADIGGSFERIEQMRPVPFTLKDVTTLAITSLVPMIPVLGTAMPMEEVLATVLKIIG